jgi:hypothetical protein
MDPIQTRSRHRCGTVHVLLLAQGVDGLKSDQAKRLKALKSLPLDGHDDVRGGATRLGVPGLGTGVGAPARRDKPAIWLVHRRLLPIDIARNRCDRHERI